MNSNLLSLKLIAGLEDFENKIDKIASGVDQDENSWINQIYDKFNDGSTPSDSSFAKNVEGLEPPMLDETWGLEDGDSKTREKRSAMVQFQKEVQGECISSLK